MTDHKALSLIQELISLLLAKELDVEVLDSFLQQFRPKPHNEAESQQTNTRIPPGFNLDTCLADLEKGKILVALEMVDGSRLEAAKLLGISFRSLRYRCAKLGIDQYDETAIGDKAD